MKIKTPNRQRQFLNTIGAAAFCALLVILNPQNAYACTNPTGTAGDQFYNTDFNVMQYCDGTDWTAMRSSTTALELVDADGNTKIQVEEGANDDTIRFDTAGSERMVIDENGKIGINTTNPQYTLHINNIIDNRTDLMLSNSVTGSTATDGATFAIADNNLFISNRENGNITLLTNFVRRMRITNEGTVSVGALDPTASALLDLQSTDKGFLPPRISNPAADITSPATGLIVYDATDDELQVYDGTSWVNLADTSGGSSLFTDNTTHITRENFHILNAGLAAGSTTAGLDGDGKYFFYDPDKSAMRGGEITYGEDAWQDVNIGANSFAWGENAKASGDDSIALGRETIVSGNDSISLGHAVSATGNSSISLGYATLASGYRSAALGNTTLASGYSSLTLGNETIAGDGTAQTNDVAASKGNYSIAFGAGNSSTATFPQVTGNESIAMFFGDQNGEDITATNVLALEGGSLLLSNDSGTACAANKAGALRLNAAGDGLEMCDGTSTWNAYPAAAGGGLFTDNTTHITRENFHILDAGLAAGSTTAGIDGDGTYSFYDPDKGALRFGTISGGNDAWEDANIGAGSFAIGTNNKANGANSVAMGLNTTAQGANSLSVGQVAAAATDNSFAQGNVSLAIGDNSFSSGNNVYAGGAGSFSRGTFTRATGVNSIAMGKAVMVGNNVDQANDSNSNVGNYSIAFGLGDGGNDPNAMARLSGDESAAFFLGANSFQEITASNVVAIQGGSLLLSNDSGTACAANKAGALRLNAAGDGLEMCDGTSTWNAYPAAAAGATATLADTDGNTQIQVEEGANDDTIRFDTAGTERMTIDADGKIIINDTAVSPDFQIGNGVSGDTFVSIPGGSMAITRSDDTGTRQHMLFSRGIGSHFELRTTGDGAGNTTEFHINRDTGATNRVMSVNVDGTIRMGINATKENSALLNLESSDKGFLPPRISNPSSDIIAPTTGLVAYDSTDDELQLFDGTNWVNLADTGDNLGNHNASQTLNLATNDIDNIGAINVNGTADLEVTNISNVLTITNPAATRPDIKFDGAGLIASETGFSINIDSNNDSVVDAFFIRKDSDNQGGNVVFQVKETGEVLVQGQIKNLSDPTVAQDAATKAYVDNKSVEEIADADGNTKIQVEEGANDNTIRFDTNGNERVTITNSDTTINNALVLQQQTTGSNTGLQIETQGTQAFQLKSDSFDGIASNIRWRQSGSNHADLEWLWTSTNQANQAISINADKHTIAGADQLAFATGSTIGSVAERMVIDENGNVGIGTTSPSTQLEIANDGVSIVRATRYSNDTLPSRMQVVKGRGTAESPAAVQSGDQIGAYNFGAYVDGSTIDAAAATIAAYVAGPPTASNIPTDLRLFTTDLVGATSERIRITSEGNILFNSVIKNPGVTNSSLGMAFQANLNRLNISATSQALVLNRNSDGQTAQFRQNGSTVGSISVNATNTSYNTTSDKRLKNNIKATNLSINDLMKISVKDYNFISNPEVAQTGFIAQDLYKVYPDAVHVGGDNPEEDAWQVDYGRVTPLIVKAVQDLKNMFDKLKDRVSNNNDRIERLEAENQMLKERLDALEAKMVSE